MLPSPPITPKLAPELEAESQRPLGCVHNEEGRNLILSVDGTANQFSENVSNLDFSERLYHVLFFSTTHHAQSTNVVELFSRIIRDEGQLAYYDSGIGTYARPSFRSLGYLKQVIYHTIDTAIAWNFESIVHAAYEWLSENYQTGDKIFLFGFSRGAYQVRVIAGMIEKVGLLLKGNKRQIPFAYELYSSVMDNSKRTSTKARAASNANDPRDAPQAAVPQSKEDKLCAQFKRTLCHENVKVHFIGAWDTVSSIGIFRGKSLPKPFLFQPEFANGGLGPRSDARCGDVKEVWFAGSHSDIGGGNILNEELANFGPSLRWVTYEAITHGLRVKPYTGKWISIQPTNSLTWYWKILEAFPLSSLSYLDEDSVTWWPHLGACRTIQPGQLIHQSVFSAFKSSPIEDTGRQSASAFPQAISPTSTKFGSTPCFDTEKQFPPPSSTSPIPLSREPSVPSSPMSIDATSEYFSMFPTPKSTESASEFFSMPPTPNYTGLPSDYSPLRRASVGILVSGVDEHLNFQEEEDEYPIPGAFPLVADAVMGSEPQLSYRPAANLSEGRDWDALFQHHLSSPLVEKDPFENVKHTLHTLAGICDHEDGPPDFHGFDATIQTLQPILNDETRQASFAEVFEGGPILISALRFLHLYRPEDFQSRNKVIRLLKKARVVDHRVHTTYDIREWLASSDVSPHDVFHIRQKFGNPLVKLLSESGGIQSLGFSSNGQTQGIVAVRCRASAILLSCWDRRFAQTSGDHSVLTPDGLYLCVADEDGIQIFETTELMAPRDGTTNPKTAGNIPTVQSECAALFVISDTQLSKAESRTAWPMWLPPTPPRLLPVISLAWDGSHLAYVPYFSDDLTIWDLKGRRPLMKKSLSSGIYSLTWSPSGKYILIGGDSGEVRRCDIDLGEIIHSFQTGDRAPISALAYRNDERLLATGTRACIKVWRRDTWKKVFEFSTPWNVTALVFSADGKELVSGSDFGDIRVWDVEFDEW
ncbi:hypothetical protein ONZ45_g7554 [Pleurotus djamor]|nr:hypothetical protein ONZ45_g7554 [Pleurotus djamor]